SYKNIDPKEKKLKLSELKILQWFDMKKVLLRKTLLRSSFMSFSCFRKKYHSRLYLFAEFLREDGRFDLDLCKDLPYLCVRAIWAGDRELIRCLLSIFAKTKKQTRFRVDKINKKDLSLPKGPTFPSS